MNLEAFNLEEISLQESKEIDGGVVPAAVAVAAACGVGLGVIIVGAAVGYGIYCLVDWATS
jgi:lactobin A/cerein 7B family class IIb bacteriocin